ncbi:hypothetical protein F4604DRAFT_2003460 [Suillus subluteus]|nr:hypothetical protein F4604DRAFT_2003460 [Suillus subluteus]
MGLCRPSIARDMSHVVLVVISACGNRARYHEFFQEIVQKSYDDNTPSLKHSKSMTFGLSSRGSTRDPRADPLKPAYRGKTLKTSDIVCIEQAPRILDIHRAQWYPDLRDLAPPRDHFDSCADLLDQFPNPPPPPPRPLRSALRTTSLNSKNSRPQLPLQNCRYQHVAGRQRTIQQSPSVTCFSRPTVTAYPSLARKQQHEATDDQAVTNVVQTANGQVSVVESSRQADCVPAKSSAGRSPGTVLLAHNNYREFLDEQDLNAISTMISRYPVAPCYEPSQEQLRPIRFDMEDPSHFRKTLSYFIHMAVAQGRPLDARADGPYHCIIDAGDPTGIVPEIGADWSRRVEYC